MNNIFWPVFILTLFFQWNSTLTAQVPDTDFYSPVPVRIAEIDAIKVQPDGKILVGGDIKFFAEQSVQNLVRLNADGSLDESFTFSHEGSYKVVDIELQSNGDIIVLKRGYESSTGVIYNSSGLLQLAPDGTVKHVIDDLSNSEKIAVQGDDRILLCGGSFYSNGYLYRYESDLTADILFNSAVHFDNILMDVKVDNDKIFVSGMFSNVSGVAKNDIVKLNLDGTIDNSFDTGSGTEDLAGSITIQGDGKLLIGNAYINSFNGTMASGMIRLNADGSVDNTFNPPYLSGGISEIVWANDKIYTAASIDLNGSAATSLIALNSDGTLDAGFEPVLLDGYAADETIALMDTVILADQTSTAGNIFGLSQFDVAGMYVETFNPAVGRIGTIATGKYVNGKLIVGGEFVSIDGLTTYGVAKLNSDGSVDESFVLNENRGAVKQIEITSNQDVMVSTGANLFKLDLQGEVQSTFNFQFFKNLYWVEKFRIAPDGKIYVGDSNDIHRINADGSEDTSFDIGTGKCCMAGAEFDFDLQGEKVIYGSFFTEFNGVSVNRLVRLNPDATVDASFNIGDGPDDAVSLVKVLDNNEIIVDGFFTQFDGVANGNNRVVKLSENGTIDPQFTENALFTIYFGFAEQFGNRVFLGTSTSLILKNLDGSTSSNMNISGVTFHAVENVVIASPDSVFLLGSFSMNGDPERCHILKLFFNKKPVITAIDFPLSIPEDSLLTITGDQLMVAYDDKSPLGDFIFTILDGPNYSVNDKTIVPDSDFYGTIDVSIVINDGVQNSVPFTFHVTIEAVNDAPEIVNLNRDLNTFRGIPLKLSPYDFIVNDPDNNFPKDFTLSILGGDNYTVNGTSLVPDDGFIGTLTATIIINDGMDNSVPFSFPVSVNEITAIAESNYHYEADVYPNPIGVSLNIRFNETAATSYGIKIYDFTGQAVYSSQFAAEIGNNMTEIDLQDKKPGMYVLEITRNSGKPYYSKFLKRSL